MLLVLLPLLFATYISSTMVLSYQHHASDCFFGAGIGCLTALLSYRTAFRSIFDARLNWKPRIGRRLREAIEKEKGREREQEHETTRTQRDIELGPGRPVNLDTVDGAGDRDG